MEAMLFCLGAGAGAGFLGGLLGIGGGLVLRHAQERDRLRGRAECRDRPGRLGGVILRGLHDADIPSFSLGYVHLPALAAIVCGSALAAPLGAAVSHGLPVQALKKGFAFLLFGLACKMVVATA